jgi:hypothetical protein
MGLCVCLPPKVQIVPQQAPRMIVNFANQLHVALVCFSIPMFNSMPWHTNLLTIPKNIHVFSGLASLRFINKTPPLLQNFCWNSWFTSFQSTKISKNNCPNASMHHKSIEAKLIKDSLRLCYWIGWKRTSMKKIWMAGCKMVQ